MKTLLLAGLIIALTLTTAASIAADTHSDQETKADMGRHRAMAAAHLAAAQCLESGKKQEVCNRELQAACKELAIGKYCGMKHAH